METNKVYQICKQIAKDNKLSPTNDILIAIAKGYERGYDDCARFASNLIDNEFNRTEGCDKSRDGLNLQILLINNICEAAVQHGYDELCDLSNSEGLIASLEDWIKINNLEDFCHVVYVDDPDCLCGIKIGRKENTSDDSNR